MHTVKRPSEQELSGYFTTYSNQVNGDDFFSVLTTAQTTTVQLLESLSLEQWNYKYAAGKWSIKEMFLHIIDTERIFAYRALRIARNDKTPLAGYEQDDYIPYNNPDNRSPISIIEEYDTVRAASISLFKNLNDDDLARIGTASNTPLSARAIGFVIAGHEIHHLNVLHKKYLNYVS